MARCSNTNPHPAHDFYAALHEGRDPHDNLPDSRCEGVPLGSDYMPGLDIAAPMTNLEKVEEMRRRFLQRYPGLVLAQDDTQVKVQASTNTLAHMMRRQLDFQLKLHPDFLQMTNNDIMDYIRTNTLSLVSELVEMMGETNWKPWAAVEPGIKSRSRYLKEIIDAQHFLFNLALVAGVTPDEYYMAYMEKNDKNFQRQENGYDGNNPRCEHCGDEIEIYKTNTIMDYTVRDDVPSSATYWCSDECYNRWLRTQPTHGAG